MTHALLEKIDELARNKTPVPSKPVRAGWYIDRDGQYCYVHSIAEHAETGQPMVVFIPNSGEHAGRTRLLELDKFISYSRQQAYLFCPEGLPKEKCCQGPGRPFKTA